MQAIDITYNQLASNDTLLASLKALRDRKELSISHAKGLEIVGELHRDLLHHRYSHKPCRLRTVNINGKLRDLDTPQIRDMVLQSAWSSLVSQAVEKQFSKHSFGFRPNLSCHKALIELKGHLELTGKRYALKADIHKFFDCIPRLELIRILKTLIQDQDLLQLTVSIIETAETFKGLSTGLPTGWPMNPLLANIYLHSVDRYLEGLGIYFLRYADDIIIPTETIGQAAFYN
jgi:retron-type reverse transcriptase